MVFFAGYFCFMKDTYLTIQDSCTGEFRDRGSKFIAYAFPASTQEEWQMHLEEVKKQHPKARHQCFAFRLGPDGQNYRANDDGEPSGTAGRPILGQIDSFGLTNVFVVVIRYFGGTLLGTSGLINAYKTSALEALSHAIIIEKTLKAVYRLTFQYDKLSNIMNALKKLHTEILSQDFNDLAIVEIGIKAGEADTHLLQLKAQIAGVYLEEAHQLKEIPGVEITFLGIR